MSIILAVLLPELTTDIVSVTGKQTVSLTMENTSLSNCAVCTVVL